MTSPKQQDIVRIELTPDQKHTVKAATAKDADALELTVQELEQRIAPTGAIPTNPTPGDFFRLAGNHNETFLADDV